MRRGGFRDKIEGTTQGLNLKNNFIEMPDIRPLTSTTGKPGDNAVSRHCIFTMRPSCFFSSRDNFSYCGHTNFANHIFIITRDLIGYLSPFDNKQPVAPRFTIK